ncbi:MAG TPA: glycerophosphodiester phosphodiesterase [Gemmatimonadaceae bacterium]|nr:glycerophosphodiester phosphodiesterase [Gemmatimonadaceae bacterium]
MPLSRSSTILVALALLQQPAATRIDAPTRGPLPIVIGHRGASGDRPEHTLESYALAVSMGADYIEPDLVSTKDGILVARHENEIGGTTDVASRFADRRRTQVIDGDTITGWWTEDLTLVELKTLRARERLPTRGHTYDGQFEVPTFDEVLALAARLGRERGRAVGVYPETKHAAHFRRIQLPLEDKLVASLQRAGLNRRVAPVFIQSFEIGSLLRLRPMTPVRLVQLVNVSASPPDSAALTFRSMQSPTGLRRVRRYADGIGVAKELILTAKEDGTMGRPSTLVRDAHAAGLLVHIWTIRSDAPFLPKMWNGDQAAEVRMFAKLGVDGVFTDFPGNAVAALRPGRRP